MLGAVEEDLLVDFVRDYDEIVGDGEIREDLQLCAGIDPPVGLDGLTSTIMRVRGVIKGAISSRLIEKLSCLSSGASTTLAPVISILLMCWG